MSFYFDNGKQSFVTLVNGVSGLSIEAIAKLADVDPRRVARLIDTALVEQSTSEYMLPFFGRTEESLIIETYRSQKIFNSDIAVAAISHYAIIELRKEEAQKSLARFARIGITAFIQTVTNYHIHEGSSNDLHSLLCRVELLEAVRIRQEMLIKNNEYFSLNYSSKLEAVLEMGISFKDYFADLAVMPLQNQRNFFKAYRLIVDTLWFIHGIRKDFRVASIHQLSKDKIDNLINTAPKELVAKTTLIGQGKVFNDPEWRRLFSLEWEAIADEINIGQERPGQPGKWGSSKENLELENKRSADAARVELEDYIHRVSTWFADNYKTLTPIKIHECFRADSKIYNAEYRINTLVPGLYQRLIEIRDGYSMGASTLRSIDTYLKQINSKRSHIKERLAQLDNLLDLMNAMEDPTNKITVAIRYPEYKYPLSPRREHCVSTDLYDFLQNWTAMKSDIFKSLTLDKRSDDEVTRILTWAQSLRSTPLEDPMRLPKVFIGELQPIGYKTGYKFNAFNELYEVTTKYSL